MRHVVVMTTTGMLGLSFMFIVDAVTLFWVASLQIELFVAAIGFAWSVQFFAIGISIAFMIAATALVAKSMGENKWEQARKQASASMLISVLWIAIMGALAWWYIDALLILTGAHGSALDLAADFLKISLPSLPFIGVLMVGGAILRAQGDAMRAMYGTLSSGVIALIVDPILIVWLNWGLEGAAWGLAIARAGSAALVFYFVVVKKRLLAPINLADLQQWFIPFMLIALPAIITQISTPVGNYIATSYIAQFGDGAVAGWATLNRILVVALGGIFALSGAIGGIIGQNYGALQFDRVRMTYCNALIFSTIYVAGVWLILALFAPLISQFFSLTDDASTVLNAFCYITAGSFIFGGALYIANASFNNLGRPSYSAIFNWLKDGLCLLPLIWILIPYYGAVGVVYASAIALTVAGLSGGICGWIFIAQVEKRTRPKT